MTIKELVEQYGWDIWIEPEGKQWPPFKVLSHAGGMRYNCEDSKPLRRDHPIIEIYDMPGFVLVKENGNGG